ncbi:MAG TPA: DUF6602 domain-containing protein [Polyangiaceae bacterium]|nr:DUF6602 domain-containing protein [Polyangiaceae bacterium]
MDLVDALRQRLVAQAGLFAALSSHKTVTGAGRERALADLLREVLPRRVEILSGVVARMDGGKPAKSARQVDLLIADTHDFPLLARSGDLAVVLPDSVRAMVEVKTRVSPSELAESIGQLAKSRAECTTGHTWYSALFSYTYPKDSTDLREGLSSLIERRNEGEAKLQGTDLREDERQKLRDEVSLHVSSYLPDLIVSEKGAIAVKAESTSSASVYRFYKCTEDRAAVVFVSQLLTAVVAETMRVGAVSDELASSLRAAVGVHQTFLEAKLESAGLADLPL